MSGPSYYANSSSTLDPPVGVPLYIRRDEGGFRVTDVVGLRYGWGETIDAALAEWAFQVNDLLTDESPFGPPISHERDAYRTALAAAVSETTP